MLTELRKKKITTALIIVCEFVIFAFITTDPGSFSGQATDFINAGSTIPAVFLLFGAVLPTLFYFSQQAEKNLIKLQGELADCKETLRTLKNQYEETIEKRVFELQTINGTLNREIAERTQAEEEIRELQKQLSLILDSAGEGIFGLDNRGKVIFMNQAASVMLGWNAEELVGKSHHELVHHTYADGNLHPEENCPIYMAYRDGLVHYNSDDVFWCKNGSSFPVEYISTPIRDRGMLTGAVVVFRDLNTFN
jgi:PAS domain S-box-containing protein